MPPTHDDIERLLADADGLEDGPAKVAMIEEAARIADTRRDDDAAFRARYELIQAASFAGQPDIMLVSYSWCLAKYDSDPERYDPDGGDILFHLLWRYKWVVGQMPDFPQFGKPQIAQMLADMKLRHKAWGSTLHAYYDECESVALTTDDKAAAVEAHKRFVKTKRDSLSNCPACVQDQLIRYHSFCGRREQAVAAAEPILKRKLTCNSVPHRTYGRLLGILWKLGDLDTAMGYHKVGYPMVARKPGMIGNVDDHIRFLALTDNLDRAAKLLARHLPTALASTCPNTRYGFLRECRLLLHRLGAAGKSTVPIRMPAGHPLHSEKGTGDVAKVFAWLDAEAKSLAAAFDARNETTGCTDALARDLTLTPKPIKYER